MQWTGTSNVYVSLVQIVQIAFLANFLMPEEIGTVAMLMLVVWFTQSFGDGGISPAIVHHQTIEPKVLNSLFLINLILGVALYLLVNSLHAPLIYLFEEPQIATYLPVVSLIIIMGSIGSQFRVFLVKELRFDLIARQEMITVSVNFLVSVTLAWMGYGIWSMVFGYLSGAFLSMLVICFYGQHLWRPGWGFNWKDLGPFVKFGQYQIGERSLIFLNARLDQLLIGSLIGSQALGIYTIAHSLVISPTVRVNQVISNVMFPVFAKLQNEAQTLRNGYLKLLKLVTILNTPILLGLAVTAPLLVPLLFGAKWNESIYILQILSVYALIRSTGSPAGSLQLAKGRSDLGFKWNLGLMLLSAPFIYTGSILGGLQGIAWSLIALQVAVFVPYWLFMVRPMIGPPATSYFYTIFDSFVPGIFMATVVWLLTFPLAIFPEAVQMGLLVISGVLLFITFTYNTEKELFNEVVQLVRSKYFGKRK